MILVVGSTGYLGSEICRRLTAAGKPVRGLVRTSSAPEKVARLKAMGVETVVGDLRDPVSLARACQGVDTVITTATTTLSFQPGDSIPVTDQQGQVDLVKAAREAGVRKFIYTSYAQHMADCPLTTAKRTVEKAVMASGMDYTILCPGIFMEVWVSPVLGFDYIAGKANIYGEGHAKNRFISLGDVAQYAVESVNLPGASNGLFEVATPLPQSWLEVVRTFEDAGSKPFELQFVPEAVLEAQRAASTDPLQNSFTTLMLCVGRGIALDTSQAEQVFGLKLVTMEAYARGALASVAAQQTGHQQPAAV